MSAPQDPPRRLWKKKRRTKKLAEWREKQGEKKAAKPAAKQSAEKKPAEKKPAAPEKK